MNIHDKSTTNTDKMIYLERYVNNGSPSGFTFTNNTSAGTRAFDLQEYISLHLIEFPYEAELHLGNKFNLIEKNQIIIHPDLKNYLSSMPNIKFVRKIKGIPLASGRTVYIPEFDCFVKLEYNQLLGRISRQIYPQNATHAIRINELLEKEIKRGEGIFYFPEDHARVFRLSNGNTLGMIHRDIDVMPRQNIQYTIIPAFSLFSKDILNPNESTILSQLMYEKEDKNNYVLEKIIHPIIKVYFELLLKFGFQIEAHAQNVCYLFTNDIIGVAIRDFESVDKDLGISSKYNYLFNPQYKCVSEKSADYQKRHSFMFDFKLGEYLLSPIIEEAALCGCSRVKLINSIKSLVNSYLNLLPKGFLPNNLWYSYPKTIIDRTTPSRPYVENNCPKYR